MPSITQPPFKIRSNVMEIACAFVDSVRAASAGTGGQSVCRRPSRCTNWRCVRYGRQISAREWQSRGLGNSASP